MRSFINADKFKDENKVNEDKLDLFIQKFNRALDNGKTALNSSIDKIPVLNELEFILAKTKAEAVGWILTQTDDNYCTTTYSMRKKSNTKRV